MILTKQIKVLNIHMECISLVNVYNFQNKILCIEKRLYGFPFNFRFTTWNKYMNEFLLLRIVENVSHMTIDKDG